jgi:hypothetical protein
VAAEWPLRIAASVASLLESVVRHTSFGRAPGTATTRIRVAPMSDDWLERHRRRDLNRRQDL